MTEKAKTLDALTGLRFIAALAVFVHHVSGNFSIPHFEYQSGNQAVSFFFVLSGFILTYVYSDRLRWGNVIKFYFTRWARIWPLHLVCLLLFLAFPGSLNQFRGDPEYVSKLLSNFLLLHSWVPNNSYIFGFNNVSWSISVEAFFYLMFPLFLLGGQKQFWYKYAGLLLLTIGIVVGVTMISHTDWFPSVNYQRLGHNNPLLRLPEFCTGMAVGFIYLNREKLKADLPSRRPRSFFLDTTLELIAVVIVVGYPLIVESFSLLQEVRTAPWGGEFLGFFIQFTYGGFFFAAVVYLFSKSSGLISRFCGSRVMVFLGEISFAFYMIHMIVIRSVTENIGQEYGEFPPLVVGALIAFLSLAVSILLYKTVEVPAKKSLLTLYDRQWGSGVTVIPRAAWNFARTRLFIFTILLAVSSVGLLERYKVTSAPPDQIQAVIKSSDPQLRGIKFDSSLELLGCKIEPEIGRWRITLAWKKLGDFPHRRFVHICDEAGEVVGHGPSEGRRFRNARVGDQIIDLFFLRMDTLIEGKKIGIGFYAEGTPQLQADRGPRSMNNFRLDIIEPQKFLKLKSETK